MFATKYLQNHRRATPSVKVASANFYTWVERGTVRVKCPVHEHNSMSPPGLEPRLLNPETSALTMRSLHLEGNFLHTRHHFQQIKPSITEMPNSFRY